MRFFNSVKALYSAVGILFLAFALGYYLDVQNEAMDARHLEVNTLLERMVRLEQELSNMLSLTVVEQNELRATRYETVRQEAEASIKRLIELTKGMGVSREISAIMESQKYIVPMEKVALEKIRADQWKEARDILLGDKYVSAKKIYEIESEAIPGLVRGEIKDIEKRFNRIKLSGRATVIGALCLLLWTGFMFSRRTRSDLVEQMRLQKEISDANEALEARVRERTNELESTLQKINASEEALRQAAREQAAIFESLTLGIAFIKDRIILRGNAKLGELFGRSLDEMIGQTTRIWYKNDEEYLGIGASTYEDLKRQPVHQREQELPRKDGSLFWCLFRVRALDPQDISQGIVCTLEDITERKVMEQKIRAEGARMRQIFDTAPVCIAFSVKGRFQFTNPLFVDTFGLTVGDAASELYVHAEERNAVLERMQQDGIIRDFEIQMFDRNREPRDILVTYMPITYEGEDGILGWLTDITGRKQAERALTQRMEELERFMRVTINREKQMIKLKEEINLLLEQLGKEQKYKIVA